MKRVCGSIVPLVSASTVLIRSHSVPVPVPRSPISLTASRRPTREHDTPPPPPLTSSTPFALTGTSTSTFMSASRIPARDHDTPMPCPLDGSLLFTPLTRRWRVHESHADFIHGIGIDRCVRVRDVAGEMEGYGWAMMRESRVTTH
ncbi:hypothetical protein R3P38DRAFT_2984235 [Favolaschia claudopus]|uniref:Uncharacterized protein n=1 Tax=Favolaschia claudopus TaxID=2862362 RepID=A0AAW0AWQ6_9AGAR